jgi:hypothetical protein
MMTLTRTLAWPLLFTGACLVFMIFGQGVAAWIVSL